MLYRFTLGAYWWFFQWIKQNVINDLFDA